MHLVVSDLPRQVRPYKSLWGAEKIPLIAGHLWTDEDFQSIPRIYAHSPSIDGETD